MRKTLNRSRSIHLIIDPLNIAAILLVTLVVNLAIAALLTLITVLFYSGSSLFTLTRAHGSQGLFIWISQTKSQVFSGFNSIPKSSDFSNSLKKSENVSKRDVQQNIESDSSEDSAVVIKKEADSSEEDKTAVLSPSGTSSDAGEKAKDILS